MKFLRSSDKVKKLILSISDLHLGAGEIVEGRRNLLEDFHHDFELVEFLDFYSSGSYSTLNIELVINGDFLDFLAVPYVNFHDDEYWSEDASTEKLELIIKAHPQVFAALNRFVAAKNHKIVYIIGNHDAELLLPRVRQTFMDQIDQENHSDFILDQSMSTYEPAVGVYFQHGHQYEKANDFDMHGSVIKSRDGRNYFVPSWGSYYVTNVINKFKQERDYINAVRPIKSFLVHGLIFDPFFTLRFMFANAYFFIMVRFMDLLEKRNSWPNIIEIAKKELELFGDYEVLTRRFFYRNKKCKLLIVGHTHTPMHRTFVDGTQFINTGTWTKMVDLDLGRKSQSRALTYAHIAIKGDYDLESFTDKVVVDLFSWEGLKDLPYQSFY